MATKKGAKQKSDRPREDLEKMEDQLDEEELEHLYTWVDEIPLSRPKRNISRDFSDGVLVAEILCHHFPKLVEMHNYTPGSSVQKKLKNWEVLNRKVFAKMNFELAEDVINDLANCKPGMIEKVLLMLQVKIKRAEWARKQSEKPEADQHQSMSPGRKDGKMVKVGMDDTKGSRFMKTKQEIQKIERVIDEYGHFVTQHYLNNKGWNSGVEQHPSRKTKRNLVETDVVPRIILEEREQEVLAKDEMMKILQEKVKKLEHLIQLKDIRIVELTNQMEHNVTQAYPHHHQQGAHYGIIPSQRHHAITPPQHHHPPVEHDTLSSYHHTSRPTEHHTSRPTARHYEPPEEHDTISSYHHTSRPTGRARYEQIEFSLKKV